MRTTGELKDKTYKFRVTDEVAKKIDEYCKKRCISASDFLRKAVDEYLKNMSKRQDI